MATAGDRYTVLTGNIWSYAHRGDVTGVKAALARGVDVNLPNTVGWTACHAAAAGGHCKAIRVLVKAGANLSLRDHGGNLPAHQAAQNGHVQALKVLQDLGADLTQVPLSQAKGNAVRDFLKEAYKNGGMNGSNMLDEDNEEGTNHTVVGYARTQSKSTAFWGPRKTPISCKIKKKILKTRRQQKRKEQQHEDDCVEDTAFRGTGEHNIVRQNDDTMPDDCQERNEQSPSNYLTTVQQIKRNKRNLKRGRQGQEQRVKQQTEKVQEMEEAYNVSNFTLSTTMESSSEEDEDHLSDLNVEQDAGSRFAALALGDSDSE